MWDYPIADPPSIHPKNNDIVTCLVEGVEHVALVAHELPAAVLVLGRVEGAVQPRHQHRLEALWIGGGDNTSSRSLGSVNQPRRWMGAWTVQSTSSMYVYIHTAPTSTIKTTHTRTHRPTDLVARVDVFGEHGLLRRLRLLPAHRLVSFTFACVCACACVSAAKIQM